MNVRCVHSFAKDNHHFVVDGNSGAIHVVDAPAAALIDALKDRGEMFHDDDIRSLDLPYDERDLLSAGQDIQQLIQEGLLFSPDLTAVPDRPPHVVKALCLNVAHDCNLRCKYCFAETGDFGGERQLMSLEVARQAIDFLLAASGSRRQCEVDFFGGEPLLNWHVVQETVKYGQRRAAQMGKDLRFTLTTNGVLLTPEVGAFLNEHMYNVVLSLDGRRTVNDFARSTLNGRGSVYDTIVPNYQRFVQERAGKSYYVRGTFTGWNVDFVDDILHMADLGFDQVSMEPVVGPESAEWALTTKQLPHILQEYDRLAAAMLARQGTDSEFNFFHFQMELKKGPCLYKRISGCGAGGEYLAVDPDGSLFPCHQFVGQPQYRLGHVSSGVDNLDLVHTFQDSHVLNKPTCQGCWAKYYCSGGCHANNLAFNESLLEPYSAACTMEKKRLECSIYLHAARHLS